MEKISSGIAPQPALSKFEESVVAENQVKNKLKKGFLNYAGIFVGVFLMFAVVVIVTTDISLTSFEEMAALGLDFFLLLFCSYSMYINCSDSGMRTGLASALYIDALNTFETYKKKAINKLVEYFNELALEPTKHRIIIGHTDSIENARMLGQILQDTYNNELNIEYVVVNPTAGSHCGPDTVGIAFYAKSKSL